MVKIYNYYKDYLTSDSPKFCATMKYTHMRGAIKQIFPIASNRLGLSV